MNLKKQLQNSKELEAKALKECDSEPIEIYPFLGQKTVLFLSLSRCKEL